MYPFIHIDLITERISEAVSKKMEPELQALLCRLCKLLPDANLEKRSAILGRLVQNIFKVNFNVFYTS